MEKVSGRPETDKKSHVTHAHRKHTFYTQQAETIRLVEEQLAAAAPRTDAEQDCAGGGDAMRIARYRNTR